MFNIAARRQLNRGQGDALSRAVELVVTPLLFGLAGSWLDAMLGIRPALTLSFVGVAVVGLFVKMWIGYDQEMRRHEAELLARRQARLAPDGGPAPAPAATAAAAGAEANPVVPSPSPVAGSAGTLQAASPPDAALGADGGRRRGERRREVGR